MIIISLFPPDLRLYSFTTASAFLSKWNVKVFPFRLAFSRSRQKLHFLFLQDTNWNRKMLYERRESLKVFSQWQYVKFWHQSYRGPFDSCVFSLMWDVEYKLALSEINHLFVIVLFSKSTSFHMSSHLKPAQATSTIMFLDVSNVLNTARQFLSWNINIHWQRHIPCGCRTYSTEVLMVKWLTCKV